MFAAVDVVFAWAQGPLLLLKLVQTHLRDTACLGPDHCDKVNISIKASHTKICFGFSVDMKVMCISTILQSVKCAVALCLKNNAHALI